MLKDTYYGIWGKRVRTKEPKGKVYDEVLQHWLTLHSLQTLRMCPIDVFFTATGTGLHGSTLKYLADAGYLNRDITDDGLTLEYYLNNHGHRVRRMSVTDFPTRQIFI